MAKTTKQPKQGRAAAGQKGGKTTAKTVDMAKLGAKGGRRKGLATLPTLSGLAAVFPARLRAIREKKGLKQDEVATKANLSNAYISMLERGARTPPLETVDAVAKALGVPALALLQAA